MFADERIEGPLSRRAGREGVRHSEDTKDALSAVKRQLCHLYSGDCVWAWMEFF